MTEPGNDCQPPYRLLVTADPNALRSIPIRNRVHRVEVRRHNELELNNGSAMRVSSVEAEFDCEVLGHEEAQRLAKIIADFFEEVGSA